MDMDNLEGVTIAFKTKENGEKVAIFTKGNGGKFTKLEKKYIEKQFGGTGTFIEYNTFSPVSVDDVSQEVAEILAQLFEIQNKKGVSNYQLSKISDLLTEPTLSRLKNEGYNVSFKIFVAMCRSLKIKIILK